VQPAEGASLHYRIIGFSFPRADKSNNCKLEIARGNYYSEDSFKKNVVITRPCKGNRLIAEVPFFGERYTWRIVYADKRIQTDKSELHHFSTGIIPEVDTANIHLRILKSASKYKDAYVFLDNSRALYDMKGNPVWYIPDKLYKTLYPKGTLVAFRDIKLSNRGTITCLLEDKAYEINYNGDILWQGPNTGQVSGDSIENYHHEFTRLSNGHYMILGKQDARWSPGSSNKPDSSLQNIAANKQKPKLAFGTIIEYDDKGNLVWSWRSLDYFKQADIAYYNTPTLNIQTIIDLHENAFYFDEEQKVVYVSFRNISRVLKIKYPEGTVIGDYSGYYKPGVFSDTANILFCMQHSIKRSPNGYLYLFDNNSCNQGLSPKVLVMKEPGSGKGLLKKIWEYKCVIEDSILTRNTMGGGNVTELTDNSLFVDMGGEYCKVFIVNRKKQVLWCAMPEKWSHLEKKWCVMNEYRASIITDHKKLENLIWGGAGLK